jgi:lipoprotein-anchoring transpeptidase ErfK/SrfK
MRRCSRRHRVAAVLVTVLCGSGSPAARAAGPPVSLPAAGVLLTSSVTIRSAPNADARVIRVLHRFGSDSQFRIVLATKARRESRGRWWFELSLPGRPNGQRGWVRGDLVELSPVRNRIVVHIRARTLDVERIADGRVLLRSVVAVGKPGAETPIGRDFFVQARYVPEDPFFGAFVLVTSAYSKLSDWPGGGLAGIHGTDQPQLLGGAVSHGCVRVSNSVARQLEVLAPLGTPIDLLP